MTMSILIWSMRARRFTATFETGGPQAPRDARHANGYVMRRDGGYEIGLELVSFGVYARRRQRIYEVARSRVVELANTMREQVCPRSNRDRHQCYNRCRRMQLPAFTSDS